VINPSFEVIDHTADIGIIAHGSDPADLFSSAACGMLSLMIDVGTLHRDISRGIMLEARDLETLLMQWLNELLYIIYTEKLVLWRFEITIVKTRLEARCSGQELDLSDHRFRREIKAATYHDLEITVRGGEYSAKIIFDI